MNARDKAKITRLGEILKEANQLFSELEEAAKKPVVRKKKKTGGVRKVKRVGDVKKKIGTPSKRKIVETCHGPVYEDSGSPVSPPESACRPVAGGHCR